VRRLLVGSMVIFGILAGAACSAAPTPSQAPTLMVAPATAGAASSATSVAPTEPAAAPSPAAGGAGNVVVFRIVPDQSQARFQVDEILGGEPNTVVGTTSDVSGEIRGDFASSQTVQLGPIQVDMSTLKTDNNFRNRALHDFILSTGSQENRYAVFQLTSVEGLPPAVSLGTAYPLTLTGELSLHGVTRTVSFDATVTPVSQTRLEGTASVSLPYSDFGVNIPRLPPQVASVGDTVTLQIDFVAEAS